MAYTTFVRVARYSSCWNALASSPHHVAYMAYAESAPLRSSASFRNALIRRPVSDGLWLVRIRGQETRRSDSAISGALRVARLVSYLRRKRNYHRLHLYAASGRDQWHT